jgi:MFS superfamily sulfate permease-like transporter
VVVVVAVVVVTGLTVAVVVAVAVAVVVPDVSAASSFLPQAARSRPREIPPTRVSVEIFMG